MSMKKYKRILSVLTDSSLRIEDRVERFIRSKSLDRLSLIRFLCLCEKGCPCIDGTKLYDSPLISEGLLKGRDALDVLMSRVDGLLSDDSKEFREGIRAYLYMSYADDDIFFDDNYLSSLRKFVVDECESLAFSAGWENSTMTSSSSDEGHNLAYGFFLGVAMSMCDVQ